jgi:hypothetical protein
MPLSVADRYRTLNRQRFMAVISRRHRLSAGNTSETVSTEPLSKRKGQPPLSAASQRSNRPVLRRLGWNSYGTEGAQRMAKVQVARNPKMA